MFGITKTCRLMHQESLPGVYSFNSFKYSIKGLWDYLRAIPAEAPRQGDQAQAGRIRVRLLRTLPKSDYRCVLAVVNHINQDPSHRNGLRCASLSQIEDRLRSFSR